MNELLKALNGVMREGVEALECKLYEDQAIAFREGDKPLFILQARSSCDRRSGDVWAYFEMEGTE